MSEMWKEGTLRSRLQNWVAGQNTPPWETTECQPTTRQQQEATHRSRTSQDHRVRTSGIGKRIRSVSPSVGRTPRHRPLLTVQIMIAGEEVDAVVDTGASAPVIGERIAKKLGCWKRARNVNVRQGDGSTLAGGKYVVNTTFKVFFEGSLLGRFTLDVEVLDIGKRDVILGLSWLEEQGFWVDTQARCLWKDLSGLVFPCSIRSIPSVSVLDIDLEPLEDGEILLIIDASE